MTVFRIVRLSECVDLLAGFAFKSQGFTGDPDDIPLVKGENVSQGCILWDASKRWPAVDWEALRKYQLRSGDVVLAMDRPWVPAGLKWAFIKESDPKSLLVQRCARLRSKIPDLDQRFLRFIIGSPAFEAYVRPITSGVNVPHISGGQILDYSFPLPPLPFQRRIADILSAYDDLIANCQRRIEIVEQMARGLYREWFVKFRYPGHESVPLVSSTLGEIPKGWKVSELRGIADVNRAQVNVRRAPENIRYIDISSVSPGRIDQMVDYAFADAPGRARRIVSHGDVLWSCIRPNRCSYALVMNPKENTLASTGFAVLSASAVPFSFLYLSVTTEQFVQYLVGNATGAAYPAVTATTFEKANLVVPTDSLLRDFDAVVFPVLAHADSLHAQIENLRRTRDLLLPRLISGQLEVDAA